MAHDLASGVAIHGGRAFLSGILFDAEFRSDVLVRAYELGGGGR